MVPSHPSIIAYGISNQAIRAVLKGGGGFVTPTEMNIHGDALCFMFNTWTRHKTAETVLAVGSGWRLAVGGCCRSAVGSWRLAVGGWWQLAVAVGGWRLAGGGWWRLAVGGP